MTDWCWLYIGARGDKKELDIVEEVKMDFNHIIPMPKILERTENKSIGEWDEMNLKEKFGYESWYEWRSKNWGTKDTILSIRGE